MTLPSPFRDASRYIELLTGSADTPVWFRLIPDKEKDREVIRLYGSLSEHWERIVNAQRAGYGVFMVVNEGGNKGASITKIRAVFIDADGRHLPNWHVAPDFIVQRDDTHWHAYWRTNDDFPLADFPLVQKRLANHYGTDPAVIDKPRVMRIPGFLHQKGKPVPVSLIDHTGRH